MKCCMLIFSWISEKKNHLGTSNVTRFCRWKILNKCRDELKILLIDWWRYVKGDISMLALERAEILSHREIRSAHDVREEPEVYCCSLKKDPFRAQRRCAEVWLASGA